MKIYGEDGKVPSVAPDPRAFSSRPRLAQALVLIAGIAMNLFLRIYVLPARSSWGRPARSRKTNSRMLAIRSLWWRTCSRDPRRPHRAPAGRLNYQCERCRGGWQAVDSKSFSEFIARSGGGPVELRVKSGKDEKTITATPRVAVASADPSRYVLGVEVVTVGVVPLSFGTALIEGAQITWGATKLTAVGLWHFFYGIFTFSADLSQIAGPVGIAGVVGSASAQGLGYLFSIMAIISINLALINLIPVPALDGGRLLFVLIESIIRRPIKASIAHAMNAIGFVFPHPPHARRHRERHLQNRQLGEVSVLLRLARTGHILSSMRQSRLFTKTRKLAPADEVAKNAQLLVRAGYIHKEMAGVYSYLPLGKKVLEKIERAVREEMDAIGGQEIPMATLHPSEPWKQTGAWDSVDVVFKIKSRTEKEYTVGQSEEEIVTPIAREYIQSYRDLPRCDISNRSEISRRASSEVGYYARSRIHDEGHVLFP